MFYKILDKSYGNLIGYLYTDAPIKVIEEIIRYMKDFKKYDTENLAKKLREMGHEAYIVRPESIYL